MHFCGREELCVRLVFLVLPITLLANTCACGGANLHVALSHTVSGEPLFLETFRYANARGEAFAISRVSYLLSEFALETAAGNWTAIADSEVWIDAGKQRLEATFTGIPPGQYRAVRFNVGVGPDANHADPAGYGPVHPLNPNLNQLHWNWQGGYIFMALEGRYRREGEMAGFVYHLANDRNRTRINLTAAIDLGKSAGIEITLDLGALLNLPQPISFSGTGASTHSHPDDPIAERLVGNLPGAFQVRRVTAFRPDGRERDPPPIDFPEKITPYRFRVSGAFPIPILPTGNPLIEERVRLGERLFNDPILSRDGTIACASCHNPLHGFSDPRRFSLGIDGHMTRRNAMPLLNLAWKSSFFWDGRAPSLRAQALVPIEDPLEMGEDLARVVEKLSLAESYRAGFSDAFGSGEISAENIGLAIEAYLLTLTSHDSRFDRAMKGRESLTELERRGLELFTTEHEPRSRRYGADCFHCHGGVLFSDHQFHNNGLAGAGDEGLAEHTGKDTDKGKFATPSLRNVAVTAPYMHDGRFSTLDEVVAHYNAGVERSPTLDPNLAKHPKAGLGLGAQDRAALVAFLKTLTDFRFTNRWDITDSND